MMMSLTLTRCLVYPQYQFRAFVTMEADLKMRYSVFLYYI